MTDPSAVFVLFFCLIKVVLFLKRFTQSLVCETNKPLLIPHFIKSQAAYSVISRHR